MGELVARRCSTVRADRLNRRRCVACMRPSRVLGLPPGHRPRSQALGSRQAHQARSEAGRALRSSPAEGSLSMADPRGVYDDAETGGDAAAGGRADSRLERGLSGYAGAGRAADHLRAGGPLHGLRHSVLPHGMPAGQSHSGVERPRLAQRLGRSAGTAARDQQLSRVHRSALSGAL